MNEEATVYDLYDKTKEMGLHSDELWEWGLPERKEARFSNVHAGGDFG
nr:hypothetical protein [uncultured Dethiosulfovibrio sp.]